MTLIHVPRPPKSAMNPDRSVSALLQTQIEHLHQAEKRLPLRYRTEIYVNAIKTEGEAARYIREVTEAIHAAHEEMARARPRPTRAHAVDLAASAEEPLSRKRHTRARAKKSKSKTAKKR
jgi:hypothetical protein